MKILIYDIETLKEMFLISIYLPDEGKTVDFFINKRGNHISGFLAFVEQYKDYYWVGYNCLRFDSQVIEFILRNYQYWEELSWKEVCDIIYQCAQDTIHDANYDVYPAYREDQLTVKQVDLFLIWHFNNKNRMVSLKRLAYEMDFHNIEEMPIAHDKEEMTDEEIDTIISYCHNDVMATYEFYKITRGETNHPLYEGKDKIKDRFIIEEEVGLRCLNFDDVKIGAEWNKLDYMKLAGVTDESELRPKKVVNFYGKKYSKFFPKTVEFQTKDVKDFVKMIGSTTILNKPQFFRYKFNDELTVNVGRGGLHSQEKPRMIVPRSDEIYLQCDIGSQYPNAIRKYKIYPSHLGKVWNDMLTGKIERRLHYKQLAKETGDPKYASLQEMGKLSLNGVAYGRLNTKGDWQEDPCAMLKVTIGCQLEILMIVEALVLKGFNVVSVNTDGFDVVIKRKREAEFKEICTYYEAKIGNSELGNIEYTEFKWIAQTSVNDYIALKPNGEVKRKGDFTVDFELHKNKSGRIIPIALGRYFVDGIAVSDTIRSHDNIYDFTLRQKASKDFHYEGVITKKSEVTTKVYNKLIRYYVSNSGEKLYKIKNPECKTKAPPRSQLEAGKWLCTVCNYLPAGTKVKDCDINYDFYIEKAEEIIRKIDKSYKKQTKQDKQQLSLW